MIRIGSINYTERQKSVKTNLLSTSLNMTRVSKNILLNPVGFSSVIPNNDIVCQIESDDTEGKAILKI